MTAAGRCRCCWPQPLLLPLLLLLLPLLLLPPLLLLKRIHLPLQHRYFENRVKAVTAAKERGENPYPHK